MAVSPSRTGTKVITGECRISFPNLFKPRAADEDSAPKYSVQLLIPKTDKATIRALREAEKQAAEEGASKFKGGKVPKNLKSSLHDGDEDDLDQYPEREGHYRISVSANESYPPGIVDRDRNPILDAREVYSGCYARASLVAFAYSARGNQGVGFGLRNRQKRADGDPLGNVSRPEDEVDEEDDEDDVI